MNIVSVEDVLGRSEVISAPEDCGFAVERGWKPAEGPEGQPVAHGWSS